jgi:hypothetical protein
MARPYPLHSLAARLAVHLLTAAVLAVPESLAGQGGRPAPLPTEPPMTEVGFDSGRWTFSGGAATPTMAGSDTAWAVPGVALLRDVVFEDGVIELDAYAGFPALVFHAESPDEYETVYLRTPMTGRPDALQYAPVHRRFLAWRLYPDGQAAATFDTAGGMFARNRVRVVVEGREARVYVNGSAAPSLVAALRHPARGGSIGVWGMAIAEGMQRFARFRYAARPGRAPGGAAPPGPAAVIPGAVTRWELSPLPPGAAVDAYPPADSSRRWRPVTADFDGLVNLSRYSGALVAEGRAVPVAARAVLTRGRAGPARLAFAYCDRAAVFLNGRRVFVGTLPLTLAGDNPRMAARDTVRLDMRAGPNELLVVTTGQTYTFGEPNGGWGFAARLLPEGAARPSRAGPAALPTEAR